jgi:carbonic anhydrase
MHSQTKLTQKNLTPIDGLNLLIEGNKRFTHNIGTHRNLIGQVVETSQGQYPFAVIHSCIDSRVPVELVFDQGIGDVFSSRVAGNIINEDVLGSMEFSCKVAGAKILIVMGHSSCGAVKGACDNVELGNLTTLLSKMSEVISSVEEVDDRTSANSSFVQRVADKNVEFTLNQIKEQSPILNKMFVSGEIIMIGAMYHVETGEVTFDLP